MPYTCMHCLLTQGSALCPGCLQFLSDDIDVVEADMQPLQRPVRPLDWCTAFGHWGDVFVCCGHIIQYLRMTGQERCNVLYVGPDLGIAEWLREQPFVGEALGIRITNADTYPAFWLESVRVGVQPADWLKILEPLCDDLPAPWQVTQTHINTHWFHRVPAQMWHQARLPRRSMEWAFNALAETLIGDPLSDAQVIHVHPVSVWSETAENHWPHWLAAIQWLIQETPHTYVVTGQKPIADLPDSARLINLIGQTRTNMEVLAISELCDAVISTPNNVAIWGVIQQQAALVVGNAATRHMSSYYLRFLLRGEKLSYLGVDASLEAFVEAAQAFQQGRRIVSVAPGTGERASG